MARSRLLVLMLLGCAAATSFLSAASAETVLLDFTSPQCPPCAEMEPVLRQLEAEGTKIQRVDVSQDQELAKRFRIEVTPTYIVLIDGTEWARVEGVTPHATMVEMLAHSAKLAANAQAAPAAAEPNDASPAPQTLAEQPPQGALAPNSDPFASRAPAPATAPLQATTATPGAHPDHLIAATVRLSIADPNGKSTGTGAIVASQNGSALVLTCGHLFRESQGRGAIEISIFEAGASGAELRGKVAGELIDYDLDRDLALVRFRTESQVAVTPIAPAGALLSPGEPVVSVGCNHGDNPTARSSNITTINRYAGHPNVEAAGAPVEGRSGGPLYNAQGQVIGVCFAANQPEDEGLYASLASIQSKLDELQLTSVYAPVDVAADGVTLRGQEPTQPPSTAFADQWPQESPVQPPSPNPAPAAVPAITLTPAPMAATPNAVVTLPPAEQAAFEEIARRSAHAEVICIIRPKDPALGSSVIKLSDVSPAFVHALTDAQSASVAAAPGDPTATLVR